jgi:feruloyl esterase
MRIPLLVCALSFSSYAGICDSLSSMKLPATTITLAQVVDAGSFAPPGGAGNGSGANAFKSLPAFCRVAATLTPSADSEIRAEFWLPVTGWNGKLQVVGNGGYAGSIGYPAMAKALSQGYATAGTDTGHTGGSGSFAAGHPEKLVDFGYRAVHETTVQAKAVVRTFYATEAKRSYWNGCSTGGRQGLMSAQKYPADFDGIVAGAPANYMSHLQPWSLWVSKAMHETEASYIQPEKYAVIHKAVLDACDALDGVKDGVIEDPSRCHFDPKTIECTSADTSACLTPAQVIAARLVYSDAVNPRTGAKILPSLERGGEMGWGALGGPQPMGIPLDTFRYIVYGNPTWDWRTVDFDKDVAAVEKAFAGVVDAVNPDLSPFFNRGGRLLMYHGWNDQLIAPRNSIDYFNAVSYTLGTARTEESMRLYMVPGMNHCAGGDGTTDFNMLTALEAWVEQGQAPNRLIASRPSAHRTRPLCPYPQVARYQGAGSTDEAENFACVKP